MKAMTTLGTAIAFASMALVGSDALAQSDSANSQASGQGATHGTPAAPHADASTPGVGGTQGANSGTNTSAGAEGADIPPTNRGAAEAGMPNSTADRQSGSTSGSAGSAGAAGAGTSGAHGSSSGHSGSGGTSASGSTGASGNSARSGASGMDDPARTADRPGVTGAPDEMEREQRDLERDDN